MAKGNRKARNKIDMELVLYGKILHPTKQQVKQTNADIKARKRRDQRNLNLSRFQHGNTKATSVA